MFECSASIFLLPMIGDNITIYSTYGERIYKNSTAFQNV